MANDYEALQVKKREIEALAVEAIRRVDGVPPETAKTIAEAFVHLTPPAPAEQAIRMITLFPWPGGGTSRKPGNIFLNWRKLMDIVPDVTIASAAAPTSPCWLWPLIGLYIWNKLYCGAQEDLTEVEACVILALWKNGDGRNRIPEVEGFVQTNVVREKEGIRALTRPEYDAAINRLLSMKCIEMEDGVIRLRECVRISY